MTCGNFDLALKMKSFRSAFKTHPQTINIVGALSNAFYFNNATLDRGKIQITLSHLRAYGSRDLVALPLLTINSKQNSLIRTEEGPSVTTNSFHSSSSE